jgi:hypothetical protein
VLRSPKTLALAVAVVAVVGLCAALPGLAADRAPEGKGSIAAGAKGGQGGAASADVPVTGDAGGMGGTDATSAKAAGKRGPAPLSRRARAAAPPAPASAKPGEGPPPPSPLTMDALKQDMKRGKDSGGLNPDAPARTKVEQVLAEMVKTREALRDDASRLESLTGENGSDPGGGASAGAAAEAVPGQPPQKNPLDVLAKALRGIKPEAAAPIVARIDRNLAATVLLKMPPVDAGKIMGALKPDVAAELATQIALRAKPVRGAPVTTVKR